MNRLVLTVLNIVWSLWFGGLIMLLIAVQSLFHTFATDHTVAGDAASGLFQQFNLFRLGLAGAALLITAGWWVSDRAWLKLAMFTLFALATLAAVGTSIFITPRLEHLRLEQLTKSTEFARLHGMSMGVYLVETILIFIAGLILPNVKTGAVSPRQIPGE